jgi:hypothetical protein
MILRRAWLLLLASSTALASPGRYSTREAFFIGVCVGQAVDKQGLSVPIPQRHQPLNLDSPTQAALQEAFDTCMQEARGQEQAAPQDPNAPSNPAPAPANPAPAPANPAPTPSGTAPASS